jgi:endonuclease III
MDLYFQIKKQRMQITAPVDTIGCHCVPENLDNDTRKFQILVSLLLSSQTKDQVTHKAIELLNEKLGVLSAENVRKAPDNVIHDCINKVGYHNKKLKFLKSISQKPIPNSLEEALSLEGVGKKMAFLYVYHALNQNLGIAVDVHVHRICNRINLVTTRNPEESRVKLEKIVEKEEWPSINKVLVGFGQTICIPINPKCKECVIKDKCPSSRINQKQDTANLKRQ